MTESTAQSMTSPAAAALASATMRQSLDAFCAASTLRRRYGAFLAMVRWVRGSGQAAEPVRLLAIVEFLESDADTRARVQQSLVSLVSDLDCLALFAEAGLPSVEPFTTEILQRIARRLVPSARQDSDARKLLSALYSSERNARQFAAVPGELFQRIAEALTPADDPDFWQRQMHDLREAMRLLAARIAGLGLTPEMRERSSATGVARSPFYELVQKTEELTAASASLEGSVEIEPWKYVVSRCRAEMETVYEHMESAGISVELVFDLKTIQACLARMETIARVLAASGHEDRVAAVHVLLSRLIEGNVSDKQISSLLRDNLNLLARKVVDRTGDTGDHYIATDKAEYWHMWRAALGGGLLTVFTAAVKLRIIDAHLPPFFEGFASGTNYAVSFVLLQVFGLALATKQPATTAAAFARIIRDNRGQQRSSRLTDFVARITSTQLAAAIGNIVAVSAGAVLFEFMWSIFFRQSYLPELSATHVYETLNPFASGTALFAIETGVILWMAALAGSWIENAAAFYRLGEAVAQHPIGSRLGAAFGKKASYVVMHNIGGWSTSIVLGYLLGFAPVVGEFFGLPIDVRHVTLSTGTLALAAARFGTETLGDRWFLNAVVGIAVIFVLNLWVSFSIAAFVALRAYDVRLREQMGILRFLILDAVRSPLRFIVPKYDQAQGPTPEAEGEAS